MTVVPLSELDPDEWRAFERGFTYRLGGRMFRYESDPAKFYGDAGLPFGWFARNGDGIHASLAGTILPEKVAWIGGVRARPQLAGRMAFGEICLRARKELPDLGARSAAGGVMAGTERTPERFSGRMGIPRFSPVGERMLISLPLGEATNSGEGFRETIRIPGAEGELRDTRHAKRLFWTDTDGEFSPVFLGKVRASGTAGLCDLFLACAERVRGAAEALYFSTDAETAAAIGKREPSVTMYPWTLYGTGISALLRVDASIL